MYSKFIINKDAKLFALLDTYLFQKRPLNEILKQYIKEVKNADNDGKSLYGFLINEIRSMRKDREELVDIIVKYVMENEEECVSELTKYIIKKINV